MTAQAEARQLVELIAGPVRLGENVKAALARVARLTTLMRGLYGSVPATHAAGAPFTRLDEAVFRYALPAPYVGVPLSLKLQSFNVFGGAVQDLATCVAYPYTPVGSGRMGPVSEALAAGNPVDLGLASQVAAQADDFGLASDPYPTVIDLGLASS
ncbi:hypothetical protein DA075_22045 [Methylobacterium currus]|uniref:Uncharacterized protein n=1 Tax=Methylobacterium currus TaxID=2051553 RepID=A0A2R4WNZ0_9HYPH|nr:hypothetical protein [Methylobacterium currus]AWB23249.1 hypothetical protein DA075_22045 [Methylobacterium currus]